MPIVQVFPALFKLFCLTKLTNTLKTRSSSQCKVKHRTKYVQCSWGVVSWTVLFCGACYVDVQEGVGTIEWGNMLTISETGEMVFWYSAALPATVRAFWRTKWRCISTEMITPELLSRLRKWHAIRFHALASLSVSVCLKVLACATSYSFSSFLYRFLKFLLDFCLFLLNLLCIANFCHMVSCLFYMFLHSAQYTQIEVSAVLSLRRCSALTL